MLVSSVLSRSRLMLSSYYSGSKSSRFVILVLHKLCKSVVILGSNMSVSRQLSVILVMLLTSVRLFNLIDRYVTSTCVSIL